MIRSKVEYPEGRVAVITGSSQGIGYQAAIQLGLSHKFKHIVLACNCGKEKGEQVQKDIYDEIAMPTYKKWEEVLVHYVPFTLGNVRSHKAFARQMMKMFGKVDVLINNAAISYRVRDSRDAIEDDEEENPHDPKVLAQKEKERKKAKEDKKKGKTAKQKKPKKPKKRIPPSLKEQCKNTLDINFRGTIDFTEKMIPLLRLGDDARVVFVTSILGRLSAVKKKKIEKLDDDNMIMKDLKQLFKQYEKDVAIEKHQKRWGFDNFYAFGNLGLNLAMRLFAKDEIDNGVIFNSCCPGYCRTAMTGWEGPRTAKEGAISVCEPAIMEEPPFGEFFSPDAKQDFVFQLPPGKNKK